MRIYRFREEPSAGSASRFREQGFLKELLLDFMMEEGIGVHASQWERAKIERTAHGKPLLQWDGHPVHFSISHSGPWWVCAVDTKPLGIDIEYPAKHPRYQSREGAAKLLAIADRFFSQEERTFLQDAFDQTASFYQIWVRKEAYLKYLGLGLSYGLSQFSVVGQGAFLEELKDPQVEGEQQGSGARLSGLSLDPELTAAICFHPDLDLSIGVVRLG